VNVNFQGVSGIVVMKFMGEGGIVNLVAIVVVYDIPLFLNGLCFK